MLVASKSGDSWCRWWTTRIKNLCGAQLEGFLNISPKRFCLFVVFLRNFTQSGNKRKIVYPSPFSLPNSENKGPFVSHWDCFLCGSVHWLESLTRNRSYPNFARYQICIDLLKCWVGHKVGSRGTAQPRKVGQPKPSISSAAQLQSKKRKERERERKAGQTGTEKATERKKEKPETNVPFLPFNQNENQYMLATQVLAWNYSVTKTMWLEISLENLIDMDVKSKMVAIPKFNAVKL